MHRFILAAALTVAMALAARADCVGQNLFEAAPADEQAALTRAADAAPYARGLLFRATRGGRTATIAGSYHLPDARHDALRDELAPALAGASALLVEFGPEEEARLKQETARDPSLMFITDGPTIPEMLANEDWARLRAALADRGVPDILGAKMRPAYLAMTLSMPACAMPELAKGEGGLDKALIRDAEAEGKPIRALEPWNTLFTIFDQIPEDDDVALLQSALVDAASSDDMAATMADLYFDREPRLIWEMSQLWARQGGLSEAEVARQMALSQDLLMDRRNRAWIPVIEAAAEAGPIVVVAGALHLSGDQGVLALLARDGWTIERLD